MRSTGRNIERHGVDAKPQQLERLEPRLLLAVQLVRDINEGVRPAEPQNMVDVDGVLFFTADDGVHGRELWRSDGTSAGTRMVRDINPTSAASDPSGLVSFNGGLLFSADDGTHGRQLWKSDGTKRGTRLVKDLSPGLVDFWSKAVVGGGAVFFLARGQDGANDLWTTDGTAAGTYLLKDAIFDSNDGDSYSENIGSLTGAEDGVYFVFSSGTAYDPSGPSTQIWKANREMASAITGFWSETSFEGLTPIGSTLYFFSSATGLFGRSPGLRRIDPGNEQLVAVKDDIQVQEILNLNNTLYFITDVASGPSLWKSDGTPAGTVPIKSFMAGQENGKGLNELTRVGADLFFTADNGAKLWRSDGTEPGTLFVHGINMTGSEYSDFHYLTDVDGALYLTAADAERGRELWRSDGTPDGTVRMSDIVSGPGDSDIRDLVSVGGMLFFTADNGTHGRELWVNTPVELGDDGTLTIKVTQRADTLGLTVRSGLLRVRLNGAVHTFSVADVRRIEIEALGGNDVVDCSGISIPTYVNAGLGNDSVTAGVGNDTLPCRSGHSHFSGN